MILQALYDLANREELVPDPDFEIKPVSWLIRVGVEGLLLGSVLPLDNVPKIVPKRLTSRSGKNPPAEFFVDNPLYVFGKSIPQKKYGKAQCKKRQRLFAAKVMLCAQKTKDPAAKAVAIFLKNLNRETLKLELPSDLKSNHLIAFSFQAEETFVHERTKVAAYWREFRSASINQSEKAVCLITGREGSPAKKHKKLKNVPQKKMSDIALSPCNQKAFMSYGWEEFENATISEEASDLAMTALNRLLHPNPPDPHDPNQTLPRQNTRLSTDTVVCYWTRKNNAFAGAFGIGIEVDEEKVQAKPAHIAEMYKSLWKGRPYKLEQTDEFYSLVLSGGQGRATVRDWIETNTQYVSDSLAVYFRDIKIVRRCPPSKAKGRHPENFPLPLLLESIADPAEQRKNAIPAAIGAQTYRASIDHNCLFPLNAFHRAILRYRAELRTESEGGLDGWNAQNRNDARSAIIKGYLNRKWRNEKKSQEVKEKMNPICSDKGYLLGQLMAVLEKLQAEALGNVNASIVDRYFAGASASPRSVFGNLLRNARHHASKAKDDVGKRGTVFNLEKLIDQLCSQFEISLQDTIDPKATYNNGFPAHLPHEQQGMFVLGYHQMRKWLWMTRDEREIWNKDNENAPRAYLWKKAQKVITDTEAKGEKNE